MTPIERVKRRVEAASRLNVSIYATPEELKKEWHRRAFATHPDRNGGETREFREIQRAYQILAGKAAVDTVIEEPEARRVVQPRRIRSRTLSRVERPIY